MTDDRKRWPVGGGVPTRGPFEVERELQFGEAALVVLALLLTLALFVVSGEAHRAETRLAVTCRYARAGLTPGADSLVQRTLTWCQEPTP